MRCSRLLLLGGALGGHLGQSGQVAVGQPRLVGRGGLLAQHRLGGAQGGLDRFAREVLAQLLEALRDDELGVLAQTRGFLLRLGDDAVTLGLSGLDHLVPDGVQLVVEAVETALELVLLRLGLGLQARRLRHGLLHGLALGGQLRVHLGLDDPEEDPEQDEEVEDGAEELPGVLAVKQRVQRQSAAMAPVGAFFGAGDIDRIERDVASDPAIGISGVLESIDKSLKKYVPREWGVKPHLKVSNLTREHLRKVITAFIATGAGDHAAPFFRQGTGTINMLVLAMLSQIAEDKQNVIFAMEEAETAIPPYAQKRIVHELRKLSAQSLFTSHSPYVLEEFSLDETVILSRSDNGQLSQSKI